jgi:zinc/manganese transport system substrate-binding protein
MDRTRSAVLGLVLLAALASAGPALAKLRVVTSHADLAALTLAVGGDRVEVTNLTLPTQDPHFVDAKPSLMLSLNRADLLIVVGLELEVGWLPTLLTGARNPNVMPGHPGYLDTSVFVEKLDVATGPVDRTMGDLHPDGNPHFTRDPRAGLRIAAGIAQQLTRLDPAGAGTYRRGYATFEHDLNAAMERWAAAVAPYRGTEVVGYHKSWAYFADWLGLRMESFVEPKPGIPPDPAHVARLLGWMRANRVAAILQEEYYPDATSRLLADKSGATLVQMPGGARVGKGESYIDYVGSQVDRLVAALAKARGGAGGGS